MIFLTGFLMAIADSVPGVSGGTIAYIMRQYENLFNHINTLFAFNFNNQSLTYLIKLGIGWLLGFVSAIFVITAIFEQYIYEISSLFLGLIFVSIFIIFKQEKNVLTTKNLLYTLLGFLLVVLLVLFQSFSIISIDPNTLNAISYVYLFFSGLVAVSAMLLPGISGSAILMIFGVYFLIIDSVHSFLTLDFSVTPILITFGVGIICGAICSIKLISLLFEKKRSMMIHIIIGLLLGSLVAIVYGPTTLDPKLYTRLNLDNFNLSFFILGIILLVSLEFIQNKTNKNTP